MAAQCQAAGAVFQATGGGFHTELLLMLRSGAGAESSLSGPATAAAHSAALRGNIKMHSTYRLLFFFHVFKPRPLVSSKSQNRE